MSIKSVLAAVQALVLTLCCSSQPAQGALSFSTSDETLDIWIAAAATQSSPCGTICDPKNPPCYTTETIEPTRVGIGHNYTGPGPCTYCSCCSEAAGYFTGVVRVTIYVDPVTGQPRSRNNGGQPITGEDFPPGAVLSFAAGGAGGAQATGYPPVWCSGNCYSAASVYFGEHSVAGVNEAQTHYITSGIPLSGNGAAFAGYLRYVGNNCSQTTGVYLGLNAPAYLTIPDTAVFPMTSASAAASRVDAFVEIVVSNASGQTWSDVALDLFRADGTPFDSLRLPVVRSGTRVRWAVSGMPTDGMLRFDAREDGANVIAMPFSDARTYAPTMGSPFVLLKGPAGEGRGINLGRSESTGMFNHCSCGDLSVNLSSAGPPGLWVETAPDTFNISDEFEGAEIADWWAVENPSAPYSRVTTAERPGHLRVVASAAAGGSDYYAGTNFRAPRVIQTVSGDWELVAKLDFSGPGNYSGAGILINGFRVAERAYYPDGGGHVIRCLGGYVPCVNSTVYFRITKLDTVLVGEWSTDGATWTYNGTWHRRASCAGVFAIRKQWDGAGGDVVADFDYVRLSPLGTTDAEVVSADLHGVRLSAAENPATGPVKLTIEGLRGHGRLIVMDVTGRVVWSWEGAMTGRKDLIWGGTNREGRDVSAGVFFVRLLSGEVELTRTLVRLK